MNESLKKYSNIFKQIKDCKYSDITIEIDDYPLYNRSNVHIIIRDKVQQICNLFPMPLLQGIM